MSKSMVGRVAPCWGLIARHCRRVVCAFAFGYGTILDGSNGQPAVAIGNPLTRYVTLLGQGPASSGHTVNNYVEGDSGNNLIQGEGGNEIIHASTPLAGNPIREECPPTPPTRTATTLSSAAPASPRSTAAPATTTCTAGTATPTSTSCGFQGVRQVRRQPESRAPPFPTITTTTLAGYDPTVLGHQSYQPRFAPPAGLSYDGDPNVNFRGGALHNTKVVGDIMYGGFGRKILEAANAGDRLIDEHGNCNLFLTCLPTYGGTQIIRAGRPQLRIFLQQQSAADGAINTSDPTSSGGQELAIV